MLGSSTDEVTPNGAQRHTSKTSTSYDGALSSSPHLGPPHLGPPHQGPSHLGPPHQGPSHQGPSHRTGDHRSLQSAFVSHQFLSHCCYTYLLSYATPLTGVLLCTSLLHTVSSISWRWGKVQICVSQEHCTCWDRGLRV